jgi:hypothetical protein
VTGDPVGVCGPVIAARCWPSRSHPHQAPLTVMSKRGWAAAGRGASSAAAQTQAAATRTRLRAALIGPHRDVDVRGHAAAWRHGELRVVGDAEVGVDRCVSSKKLSTSPSSSGSTRTT